MSHTSEQKKGTFLDNLAGLFRSTDHHASAPTSSTQTFESMSRDVNSAIMTLKSNIEKQRMALVDQTQTSQAQGINAEEARKASAAQQKMLEQQELERAITALRSEITELHTKLGTDISEENLTDLETFLEELTKQISGSDLDSRIRCAIVDRVFHEIGPSTWNVLLNLMENAGVSWPKPGGLLKGGSDEQVSSATEYNMNEARTLFLNQNLTKSAENMRGIITAWRRYPDSSSWLWSEVALRGVAGGIRCQILRNAVDKLRSESESLKLKVSELLDDTMKQIQGLLKSGVRSIEDAEKIVRGTDEIVKDIIPELAWQRAKPAVDQALSSFGPHAGIAKTANA